MTSTTASTEAAEFTGKTAVVTGAARGIGKETVALLHARGAHVVALDIRPELDSLATEFPGVVTVTGDVTAEESAARAVGAAVDAFGGLDILVNNAGRTLNKPVTHTTAQDWDSVMDVTPAAPSSSPGKPSGPWRSAVAAPSSAPVPTRPPSDCPKGSPTARRRARWPS